MVGLDAAWFGRLSLGSVRLGKPWFGVVGPSRVRHGGFCRCSVRHGLVWSG